MTVPTTWLPLNIGDYLKNTQRLSTEEHGAYLLLIMDYWINGPIKNDKKTLQNIARISPKKLQNVLAFFQEKDGLLHHARIEADKKEAKRLQEVKRKQTEAARAKKQAKTDSVTELITEPVTDRPSPSPIATTEAKASSVARRLAPDFELPSGWLEWTLKEFPQHTEPDVRKIFAVFKDHWLGKGGKDAAKVDWTATWRNWVRRDQEFKPSNSAKILSMEEEWDLHRKNSKTVSSSA